jgi:hypothetical protein
MIQPFSVLKADLQQQFAATLIHVRQQSGVGWHKGHMAVICYVDDRWSFCRCHPVVPGSHSGAYIAQMCSYVMRTTFRNTQLILLLVSGRERALWSRYSNKGKRLHTPRLLPRACFLIYREWMQKVRGSISSKGGISLFIMTSRLSVRPTQAPIQCSSSVK